jgi:hypothetical protein
MTVAFAVVVENAGYGGRAAAAVAGGLVQELDRLGYFSGGSSNE